MERFVIGAAIFAAVLIAAGGYFGHAVSDNDGFRFEINGDEDPGGGGVKGPGVPTAVASASHAAPELTVRNAVAILKVIPEDRADIAIEIANPGMLTTPTVRLDGSELVIDGGISTRRIQNCGRTPTEFSAEVRGIGVVGPTQAPVITARVPKNVKLTTSGAVSASVGPAAAAELELSGCGDVSVGDVAGVLKVDTSGSGDVTTGAAQSAEISSAGSGDSIVGVVAGKVEISLAGSGSATVASGGGPLDVSIAGSGDVSVNGGAMQNADISIAGSGGVTIGGSVQTLEVSIAGSGDVDVKGAAQSVDASIMGSGDVTVASVSGGVQKSIMGSGGVTVGAAPQK